METAVCETTELLVPTWLQDIPRWVLWRDIDGKKVPCSAVTGRKVSITNPAVGWPYNEAVRAVETHNADGVGVILNGDGLVAVDVDDCLSDTGEPNEGVQQLLDTLGATYVEISPSGRGLHVFGFAQHNGHTGVRAKIGDLSVELYCTARYITVTGRRLPGYSSTCCSAELPGYITLLAQVAGGGAVQGRSNADHLTQETHEVQAMQEVQDLHDTQARVADVFARMPTPCRIEEAGQRNAKCFALARWLKAEFPDEPLSQLKPLVKQWHTMFLDVMDTKDFSETWVDFCHGWNKVKIPYGQSLDRIFSELRELPSWMAEHDLGSRGEMLLRLCVSLAERESEKGGIFFLSGHAIAPHLGCTAQRAYQLINAAASCGYIERVTEGSRRRAAEYRLSQ